MGRKNGTLVRFEREGEDIVALWEDRKGNRWYEVIVKNGIVQF
jgi:hypothetical protein